MVNFEPLSNDRPISVTPSQANKEAIQNSQFQDTSDIYPEIETLYDSGKQKVKDGH